MSFEYRYLEQKYNREVPFNGAVNLLRQLIEKYGFMPSEIREAFFLAQYMYETKRAESIVRSEEEWDQLRAAREYMKKNFMIDYKKMQDEIKNEQL